LNASYELFWGMGASYEFFLALILIGCLPILFFAVFVYLEHLSNRPLTTPLESDSIPIDADIEVPASSS
jgi:hypothetical protein